MRAKMTEHASVVVTYRRGNLWVELLATPGRSEDEQVDAYGAAYRVNMRDWIINADDLVLGGELVEPEAGDRIEWDDGTGKPRTYEAAAENGEPPWRYADAHERRLRIHAKKL